LKTIAQQLLGKLV